MRQFSVRAGVSDYHEKYVREDKRPDICVQCERSNERSLGWAAGLKRFWLAPLIAWVLFREKKEKDNDRLGVACTGSISQSLVLRVCVYLPKGDRYSQVENKRKEKAFILVHVQVSAKEKKR